MARKDSTTLVQKTSDFIEKRLLEEYKELGFCWRHDDDVFAKLTTVLLPLSIAALTLPYLKPGTPKLLCVVGGSMLMAYWFFSSERNEDRSGIRFTRIHEIERILGFDSHLRIKRKKANSVLKGQYLRRRIFIAYIVIALLVTCDMKFEVISWLPSWQSVITVETIAFLIIIVTVVTGIGINILIRIGWNRWKRNRDHKRLKGSFKGA